MANDLDFLKVWAKANKSKQTKKSLSEFLNEPEYELSFSDGTNLGKVGFNAYQAIKENRLDSYTPYNEEEKGILDKYKEKYYSIPLSIEVDGETKNFGNVSYDAYNALISGDVENYNPTSNIEKKAIDSYKSFVEEYAKEQREPENFLQGLVHGLGYTAEKIGAGATDAIADMGDLIIGSADWLAGKALTNMPGSANFKALTNKLGQGFLDSAENRFSAKTLGDVWSESAESRYRVPDWYRTVGGQTATNFGALLPAMASEVVTMGASPAGDTLVAKAFTNKSALGLVSKPDKVANIIKTKLLTVKPSDVVFGLNATGSAAKEGFALTGDIGKSLNYGILNGLGEVATEKLFGGFGGTGIGADDAVFDVQKLASKIKGVSKLASTKYGKKVLDIAFEGVEEVIMTDFNPWFEKWTINPDAKISNLTESKFWKERGESFFQGILLSGFSNAITYPTTKAINKIGETKQKGQYIKELNEDATKLNEILPSDANKFEPLKRSAKISEIEDRANQIQRVKAINALNNASEVINSMWKSEADKFVPLKYDSTEAEIEERRNQIKTFATGYADLMADELVASNPEVFKWVNTASVGNTFKDTKSGSTITVVDRDAETTTVQVDTGKGVATRKMPNTRADSFVESGQLEKVESAENTEVAETPTETTDVSSRKNINLKRVGKFYEVYGEDAMLLAEELDSETAKIVVNGVETDMLRLPADLAERFADAVSDEYNLVLSDKPTSTEVENAIVTDETTTTDETIPSAEENATESEISVVANAMNDTFKPEAKEDLKNSDLKGDVVQLAKIVRDFYKQNGTLDVFADYFTDKGAKVISAIEGKTDVETENDTKVETEEIHNTVVAAKSVVDIISETLTPQAKENLQDGDVNENYSSMAETLIEVYKEDGTLEAFADFFTDGGKKVEAAIKGKTDNSVGDKVESTAKTKVSEAEVLKNEPASDTMESSNEKTSVEREDNGNESIRESVLSGDSRRRSDESTRKQVGGISYFEQRNQGRDATERQSFARELIERGQVEEVVDGKDKYNLVKPEAYNDDMLSMVEEARKHGLELGFFVGSAKINYDTKDEFSARGIRVSPTKIVVQYDNVKSPQKIAKHEIIHAKWKTEAVQAIRTKILKSLSSQDTKDIFAQERYARYKRIYKNDNLVLEEFVCDIMSGDTYYYADYIDIVNDYWYGNETVEGYNAADYATSKDAGGNNVVEGKYDLSDEGGEYDGQSNNGRGISGIFEKSRNSRGRDTSGERGSFRPIRQISVSENSEKHTEQHRASSRNSARGGETSMDDHSIGSLAMGRKGEDGSSTNNRRFAEALKNNDESLARDLLDEQATENGYVPVTRYRGEKNKSVKTSFRDNDIVWVSTTFDYANRYAQNGEFTDAKMSEQLHTSKHSNVYDLYAKYGKVLELGDIEQTINDVDDLYSFANRIGFTVDEIIDCMDNYRRHGVRDIFSITYTKKFADLARKKGYDSLHALEDDGKVETYGILYPENVKSSKLETYDDKGKLIPLSKRFDNTTDDIRYDLDDADNEYMEAVESGDTETVAKMIEDAAEKSFPNSKVRGDDGKLKLVYHGRVSDFNVFDRQFANIEGDFGKGYYFTSNEYDVDANYASEEGPDLKNKIVRYAEQLEYNEEYADLSDEERQEIAIQKFITSEPNTITAYLNMENPVYITPDEKGTFLDYTEEYDEEYDEYGEPEGLLIDFIEALKNNSYDYAYRDVDFNFLYEYAYDNGGMYASDAVKILKERILDELSDDEGNLAINEVIRLAFEEIGFDGIIDTSVYYKFNNMDGMDSGTTHYIVFDSEQIKSADLVTYDDKGNVIPLSERFNKDNIDIRYDLADNGNLDTQKKIEKIAKEITSHEELISLTKQNTKEFVDKIKENESLQKRLKNAKRQMLLSPKPSVNVAKVGQVTKDILKEMDSTLKATDLKDRVTSIYNEYFADIKKAAGVESKTQEANDDMMKKFAELAVDIADSSVAYMESEEYGLLKSYLKDVRIRLPESAKSDAHYAEFRKSHMGTFNLTNDGLEMDVVYQELCEMFPGMFDESITHPADQLYAIADTLEGLKPYAYNPHLEYMQDAIDHIVYRFASEVDGLAAMPKTKAQKIAEKGAYDKEMALEKERASFERKLDKHKKNSEKTIQALQKKIGDSEYVRYWEKRLSKEEKARAVKEVRDKRDIAILKTTIRNLVSDMKKKLDKTEKNGGYPKELVQAVADVCSVIDFHTDRTNKDGTPTKVSLKLDALKMQYDALKNSPNYDFQSEHSEEISNKILELHQKVQNKRVIDLTKTELTELKNILSAINHSLSIASKQIGIENAKANFEIFTEIVNDLEQIDKGVADSANQLVTGWRLALEMGESLVINPNRIFEMIANYNKDSAFWKLYEGILQGERDRKKFTMDANMPFDELTDGGGNEIAFYDFRTKNIKTGIKYTDGTEVEIPKSIICELVMLWERNDGKKHLAFGGMKIPNMNLFNKGKTKAAMDVGKLTRPITQADITRLRGMLDSYDKAWIERAYHLFNKVGKDAINETSMQLLGREIAKSKNYIRAYVDSDFVRQEIGKKNENITLEGHGSLKETDPTAQNPVVLRGLHENVYDHIDFVSKYYGLAIPIRNFNKVYKLSDATGNGHRSIKSMLGKKFGSDIRDGVVVRTINELQYPRQNELSLFKRVKGRWLGATFIANIKSTLKQTTSYWTAASILDEDSLAIGLKNYVKHRKETKAEIAKYSGTLYNRSQGLSTTELGDRANRKRLAGASSKTAKVINRYAPWLRNVPEGIRPGNWLQSMDCATASALWDACKHQVSKTMNVSDDGYMKAVADLYERVIEETQSNYDLLHRPEMLKNEALKTISMFQNDNLQQTGILKASAGNLKSKYKAYKNDPSKMNKQAFDDAKKRVDKAIRARVYSSMWMALVAPLADALLRKFKPYIDDEEKEITSRSVLEQMMLNMCEDMIGVFAPIVGQLGTKAWGTWKNGYDFMNDPAFDVLEDFIKATSKIHKAYEEDGDVLKAWTDAIPAISNMTGIPAKNIADLYKAAKGYIGDIKAGEFAHDLSDYTSGNKSFYSYGDLASCISSGDKEKETKWNDYYSANGKEFAKGSLTKEIKPVYVQMYIDSPEKAYNLKKKLILDYDYTEADINEWIYDEYLKHIVPGKKFADKTVSNPEYAIEIRTFAKEKNTWNTSIALKSIQSKYKEVYKKEAKKGEDRTESSALRKALLDDGVVSTSAFTQWEREADREINKAKIKLDAEKEKFKD